MIFKFLNYYYHLIMTINLKENLVDYLNQNEFIVIDIISNFNKLCPEIENSNISDDLKKDFKDVFNELCDTENWNEYDDFNMQVIIAALDYIITKIIDEL